MVYVISCFHKVDQMCRRLYKSIVDMMKMGIRSFDGDLIGVE